MIAVGIEHGVMASPEPRARNPRIGIPLTIGPVRLATNLLLAPIAGYCDLAFRVVCREQGGLGLACTDLLSPHGLLRGGARSLDLARTNDLDKPICMQLYGCEPDILADGARWAVDHGATVIDINMGCPVDKVTKKNGGSMLLCNPAGTVKLAERVVQAVHGASAGTVPVTAKMRLGWSADRIVAPSLARSLEAAGIAAVTVHGRTTEQKFSGSANWNAIGDVVAAVRRIPVIGNGDVTSPQHVIRLMEQSGCAGVMIGRGALSAPWIFRQAWQLQQDGRTGPDFVEPTELEKVAVIRRYFSLMLEYRDRHYAMMHMRRRISWFAKSLGPCKPLKECIRTAPDPDTVFSALDAFEAGGLKTFAGTEAEAPTADPAAV